MLSRLSEAPRRAEMARLPLFTERNGASTSRKSRETRPTVRLVLSNTFTGQQVQIPIASSNCVVTSLKLDKNRKALLERKKRSGAKPKDGMGGVQ